MLIKQHVCGGICAYSDQLGHNRPVELPLASQTQSSQGMFPYLSVHQQMVCFFCKKSKKRAKKHCFSFGASKMLNSLSTPRTLKCCAIYFPHSEAFETQPQDIFPSVPASPGCYQVSPPRVWQETYRQKKKTSKKLSPCLFQPSPCLTRPVYPHKLL